MTDDERAKQKIEEGRRLFHREEHVGAIEAFTEAMELNPDMAAAYEDRALVYRRLGRDEEAEADRAKAEFLRQTVRQDEAPLDPASKGEVSDFRLTFGWTAGLIVGLSLISAIPGIELLWFVAALVGIIAILVAVVLLVIAGVNRYAAGIISGVAVGIVSLGLTCFANMTRLS